MNCLSKIKTYKYNFYWYCYWLTVKGVIMKKRIIIFILLFAGVASGNRLLDWVLVQEFNKTQLNNVTRSTMKNKLIEMVEAEKLSVVQARRIMGSYHTIMNAAWSDWRQRRIEAARLVIEAKVQEYDEDAVVYYAGQERSTSDPNNLVSVFTVEADLGLER